MAIILIADDQPPTRQLLKFILSRENHTVLIARNGHEAIQKLASKKVDIILTDVHMPGMDGWEFLAHLRKNKLYRNLPVVVFSAGTPHGFMQKARLHGATCAIAHPFSTSELIKIVNDCLQETKSTESRASY